MRAVAFQQLVDVIQEPQSAISADPTTTQGNSQANAAAGNHHLLIELPNRVLLPKRPERADGYRIVAPPSRRNLRSCTERRTYV
jgi:hypothetical protein